MARNSEGRIRRDVAFPCLAVGHEIGGSRHFVEQDALVNLFDDGPTLLIFPAAGESAAPDEDDGWHIGGVEGHERSLSVYLNVTGERDVGLVGDGNVLRVPLPCHGCRLFDELVEGAQGKARCLLHALFHESGHDGLFFGREASDPGCQLIERGGVLGGYRSLNQGLHLREVFLWRGQRCCKVQWDRLVDGLLQFGLVISHASRNEELLV